MTKKRDSHTDDDDLRDPTTPASIVDDPELADELRRFARQSGIEMREPATAPAEPVTEPDLGPDAAYKDPREDLYPNGVRPQFAKVADEYERGERKRHQGRPPKSARIDWQQVEHLFVFGEPYQGKDGGTYVRYPSMKELGRRFSCDESSVRTRANKRQWAERRENVRTRVEEAVTEAAIATQVDNRMAALEQAQSACDLLIGQFLGAVHEGLIKVDTTADFDRIVRLRRLISGKADSRSEQHHHIPALEELQQRRQAVRQRANTEKGGLEVLGVAGRRGEPIPIDPPESASGE